ncbi:MAG: flavin reductase [Chitinophagaceae bacterium]|nr:flavin reductase [Chitinophagaceae bacterium]
MTHHDHLPMAEYSAADLAGMERFYRANLLSALSGPKAAMLVGTSSPEGRHNLALFQNIVHLGANPALIGLINRPREATPHTLAHIESTGWYTLNSVHPHLLRQAHQTSAKYNDDTSEFDATGLTPLLRPGIPAPFVAESLVQVALQLVEIMPIRHNGTYLIIGEVQYCSLPASAMAPDGAVHLQQLEAVCSTGLDTYYTLGQRTRLQHARPDRPAAELE